jgi:hypothetical protein
MHRHYMLLQGQFNIVSIPRKVTARPIYFPTDMSSEIEARSLNFSEVGQIARIAQARTNVLGAKIGKTPRGFSQCQDPMPSNPKDQYASASA